MQGRMEPLRFGEAFEQLWLLRACYAMRSEYDRRPGLTVREAIAWGEQQLRLMHIREQWRGFGSINRA
jgi:hypothetical protein